eukprot:CAMPEP_0113960226 /NCGR_PEP_ID=MMETSP0011_2-20120614/4593_1 /TAXON_ID=101924 /ORGANISM="Rhodosorus marinus" /LENGTH=375 /DNA_ID=CAMNT_0000971647 /DNA_START=154 /DNA_END=1281 /DNA_ORIENTATION=- /assembly_acc=CAM_ASM_000156
MAGFATWSAVAQGPKGSKKPQSSPRQVEKRKTTWSLAKGEGAPQKAEKKFEKRGDKVSMPATRGWRRHPGLKVKSVPNMDGVYLHYHTARGAGKNSSAPPVLFIPHGPHAPWMFEEKLLPYFARRGFSAYTFDRHGAEYGKEQRAFNLDELCQEVEEVAKSLPSPPVIVGHGTGGFIAQALIQRRKINPPAVVLLCSVPPSGSTSLMIRHFLRSPREGFRRLQAVLMGTAYDSANAMREAFFTDKLNERRLKSFLRRARKRAAVLGKAAHVSYTLKPLNISDEIVQEFEGKVMVLGADKDYWIDNEAQLETSRKWIPDRVHPMIIPDSAHDFLLDEDWRRVSDAVVEWLQRVVAATEIMDLLADSTRPSIADFEL